jgi:hypothetical protein
VNPTEPLAFGDPSKPSDSTKIISSAKGKTNPGASTQQQGSNTLDLNTGPNIVNQMNHQ